MAKTMVEVLIDDLDGSEAVESVRIGWNGQWRELDLSDKNLAALSKLFDRFWDAGRPARSANTPRRRGRSATNAESVSGQAPGQRAPKDKRAPKAKRDRKAKRDPKAIRAWAIAQGIAMPSRGRIPRHVEERYDRATTSAS